VVSSCHIPYWLTNSLSFSTRSFLHSWQSPSFLYFLSRLSVSTHRVFPSHVVSRRRASYRSTNSRPLPTRFSLIYYWQSPSLPLLSCLPGVPSCFSASRGPQTSRFDWLKSPRSSPTRSPLPPLCTCLSGHTAGFRAAKSSRVVSSCHTSYLSTNSRSLSTTLPSSVPGSPPPFIFIASLGEYSPHFSVSRDL
jgi:hypothetical protein